MPGYLLTTASTVLCAHGGEARPTVPAVRVTVAGAKACVVPPPYVVTACTLPPPPAANGPCVTATWLTGATRVTVMGQPLLLQDSQAICTPTGTPLTVVLTQLRVKAT